jgi:hypothetical protein
LLLPAVYHFTISSLAGTSALATDDLQKSSILMMSHGVCYFSLGFSLVRSV